MAAALQNATVSLHSNKIPPSPRVSTTTRRLNNLSFSSSSSSSAFFPCLKLTAARRPRGSGIVMMASTVAASYAEALLDIAKSSDTLDVTCADVEKIDSIFSDEAVAEFFLNPIISEEKKKEVIAELAAGNSLQPTTENFLNILLEAERMDIVKDIVEEFEREYNEITDTEMAVVSSVVPLESQHLAQLAKQVQKWTGAKNVRIKTNIDPSLVAGFTIRYGADGSKFIDLSVKKQLDEIVAQTDSIEFPLPSLEDSDDSESAPAAAEAESAAAVAN
ncbi:hypothetical protein Tsubulata_016722 [Turnera subulata]|uniref:ATP synthase delta chain n=1 Tax=Turnera subulata TaxID=218843 RepID=A0A9Q0G9S5_9ROSI|nr:hypothetical protein Tsubulata_016722 [Turnera subulata]